MSKGNPIIPIRLTPEILALIDAKIASSVNTKEYRYQNRTDFIKAAIQEKLAHMERSKNRKRKAGMKEGYYGA